MTAADWVTLALSIVTGVAVPAGAFVYKTLSSQIDALWRKHNELEKSFSAFQLEVAKEYVSFEHLRAMEDRIKEGFTKVETAITRLTEAFNDHRAEEGGK